MTEEAGLVQGSNLIMGALLLKNKWVGGSSKHEHDVDVTGMIGYQQIAFVEIQRGFKNFFNSKAHS